MTTENEIAVIEDSSPMAIKSMNAASSEALTLVSQGSKFLPYITLGGSSSKLVKEGKLGVGHFALMKGQSFIPLSEKFDCICYGWRPRAMDYSAGLSIFNTANPEFDRIRQAALAGTRNMAFGMEFLLYIPDHDEFALYLFGSTSARNESPNMLNIYEEQTDSYIMVNVSSYLTTNKKKDSWHVPIVTKSESAVTKLPTNTQLATVMQQFNNPVDSAVEETVAGDSRERQFVNTSPPFQAGRQLLRVCSQFWFIMFISKTNLDKNTLIGLQKTVFGSSRTHDNDLVAYEYFGDKHITAQGALEGYSHYGELIHYTFAWCMPQSRYVLYHDPRLTTVVNKTQGEEGPVWVVFFTGTLNTWLNYIKQDHPTKILEVVKEQLKKDGYKLYY